MSVWDWVTDPFGTAIGEVWDWATGDDEVPALPGSSVPDVINKAVGVDQINNLADGSSYAQYTELNGGGCGPLPSSVVVQPMMTTRLKAPRGYVIVECPTGSGTKVAMLKDVARRMGYWKAPRRPPISATDYGHLRRAEATANKIERRIVPAINAVRGKAKLVKKSNRGR